MFWRQTRSKTETGSGWMQEGVEKIKASRRRQGRTPCRTMTRVDARRERGREEGYRLAGTLVRAGMSEGVVRRRTRPSLGPDCTAGRFNVTGGH